MESGPLISRRFAVMLMICGLAAVGACEADDFPAAGIPDEPLSVLFLGSSYFNFNDLPTMFATLADSQGVPTEVEANVPNGKYLSYHAENPLSQELIRSRDWDYVVLQGVGRVVAYPEDFTFDLLRALRDLEEDIHGNCPDTRILFTLAWAFEDGMLWSPGGTDDYFAMQQIIYDNTLALADSVDVAISPVGWAWRSIMLEDPPAHYLFKSDYNHPSLQGSYLMACVVLSSISLQSVEGNPFACVVAEPETPHLQRTATRIVLDDLPTWRLSVP